MRLGMAVGVCTRAGGLLGGQRLSHALGGPGWRDSMATVTHGLGGQIALVHTLCAVLARSATILIDTLGLALATAHTGAAGSQGRRADGRHAGWGRRRRFGVG